MTDAGSITPTGPLGGAHKIPAKKETKGAPPKAPDQAPAASSPKKAPPTPGPALPIAKAAILSSLPPFSQAPPPIQAKAKAFNPEAFSSRMLERLAGLNENQKSLIFERILLCFGQATDTTFDACCKNLQKELNNLAYAQHIKKETRDFVMQQIESCRKAPGATSSSSFERLAQIPPPQVLSRPSKTTVAQSISGALQVCKVNVSDKALITYNERDGFQVREGAKVQLLDFNRLQKHLLEEHRLRPEREQVQLCDEFTNLLNKMQQAYQTSHPDAKHQAIELWKSEIVGLKRLAVAELDAQATWRENQEKASRVLNPAQQEIARSRAKSLSQGAVMGEKNPVTKVIALSDPLAGGYKSGSHPDQNMQYLIRMYGLENRVLAGSRGGGNCTLMGFSLGMLYNAALEGGENKVKERLTTLGLGHLTKALMEGGSTTDSKEQIAQTIFKNFSDPKKGIAEELAMACRQKLVEYYRKSPEDQIRITDTIAFAKGMLDANQVTDREREDWFRVFQDPNRFSTAKDDKLSNPMYHAGEVDVCVLSKLLKIDFVMYGVRENLVQVEKRQADGTRTVKSTKLVAATYGEIKGAERAVPVMIKDQKGNDLKQQAETVKIEYEKQPSANASETRYKLGVATEASSPVSPFAVRLLNRQGVHTDLLL